MAKWITAFTPGSPGSEQIVISGIVDSKRTCESRGVISGSDIINTKNIYSRPVGFVICCLNLGYFRIASGAWEWGSGSDRDGPRARGYRFTL